MTISVSHYINAGSAVSSAGTTSDSDKSYYWLNLIMKQLRAFSCESNSRNSRPWSPSNAVSQSICHTFKYLFFATKWHSGLVLSRIPCRLSSCVESLTSCLTDATRHLLGDILNIWLFVICKFLQITKFRSLAFKG